MHFGHSGTTLVICSLTYLGLAWGKVPGTKFDRSVIAFLGATILMVLGLITPTDAASAIDTNTLGLLFGMMVVVAFLHLGQFFETVAHWTLSRLRSAEGLLFFTIVLSGVLSAFLVNDVVCLAMTPLLIAICKQKKLNPVPFLLALATSSNVGSACTLIGNPQNMIIGNLSGISFARFALRLAPVSLVGLAFTYGLIWLIYRGHWKSPLKAHTFHAEPPALKALHEKILRITLVVLGAIVILLFSGQPVTLVALGAAASLMIFFGNLRPSRIYQKIDWGLLVMFIGLFIVVHGFEKAAFSGMDFSKLEALQQNPLLFITSLSALLSNIVSNVPAVLLFKPVIATLDPAQHEGAWIALGMASTLAGNFITLGSVANLIVIESARREGVQINFLEYFRLGLPLTLLTLVTGYAFLANVPI